MKRIAVILLLSLLLLSWFGPADYALENKLLLESLPELPGAKQVMVDPYVYWPCEGGCSHRHAILVTYQAPDDTSAQDVIDFYVGVLTPGWQHRVETFPIMPVTNRDQEGSEAPLPLGYFESHFFLRGTAEIGVNIDNMFEGGPHTFEVHVDSRRAERR